MSLRVELPFDDQCRFAGIPAPIPEYPFAKHLTPTELRAIGQEKPRQWRLDWAFVYHRVAVEVEGGYAVQGRHTSVKGFLNDQEKYNALALLGWRLLRVTPRDIKSGAALTLVRRVFAVVGAQAMEGGSLVSDEMWHDCVCCGIGPCDCAAVDPVTGEGCRECSTCNVAKEREREAKEGGGS
jgi:very-short-patch-repair endonuclease